MFFLLVSLLSLVGCGKDDEETVVPKNNSQPAPAPSPIEKELPSTLIAVVDSASLEPEQLIDAIFESPTYSNWFQWYPGLNDYMVPLMRTVFNSRIPRLDSLFNARVGLADDGSRQWRIQSYVFHYRSVLASGEPAVLSARITFPNNILPTVGHQLSTFTLHNHQYEVLWTWAPSGGLGVMDGRAFYNSAVISPDLQGLGVDYAVHPCCGSSFDAEAWQMADCIAAAIALLKARGVTLAPDGHSTNWGSSLGMGAALAFHRYYEEESSSEFRKAVRLSATFASEGPTNYASLLLYGNRHRDVDVMPYISIPYLLAFTPQQLDGYQSSDFMPRWMDTVYDNTYGRRLNYIESQASSTPFPSYRYHEGYSQTEYTKQFAPDMLTPQDSLDLSSPKVQALLSIFDRYANIDDFRPSLPLYMGSCPADEKIPYPEVRATYEKMRKRPDGSIADNVHWMDVPIPSTYVSNLLGGPHLTASILSQLYMFCSPEPADMANFYMLEQ